MINRKIFSLLVSRTGRSASRVYQMIHDRRRQHMYTISKETAAYLIAAEVGIDISRILPSEELAEVRDVTSATIAPIPIAGPRMSGQERHKARVPKGSGIACPYIPDALVPEATEMAKVYSLVYVFENSVRNLIRSTMDAKYGKDWWDSKAPRRVRDVVESRKKEEEKRKWHGKRGAHPILYTDIEDLKAIINTNWSDFKHLFPNLSWVSTVVDVIETSRNVIAHNNPLSKADIQRLKVYFDDWVRQISG